jgi:hypothetical protein
MLHRLGQLRSERSLARSPMTLQLSVSNISVDICRGFARAAPHRGEFTAPSPQCRRRPGAGTDLPALTEEPASEELRVGRSDADRSPRSRPRSCSSRSAPLELPSLPAWRDCSRPRPRPRLLPERPSHAVPSVPPQATQPTTENESQIDRILILRQGKRSWRPRRKSNGRPRACDNQQRQISPTIA